MAAIELKNLGKSWGNSVAVNNVSCEMEAGAFTVLLGPSGCGKSTSLRMIAGLETATEGSVLIGGQDVTHAPPSDRKLSMVFQSYALFPHLSVEENIVFGLKVRKTDPSTRRARLQKVAKLVGLAELLDRKPAQLSGGQRQRVALARAIIAENPICLMDEPLSNLDAKLRHEMRIELRALQRRLEMTVVYVTHDQAEAMSMADRVMLMRAGRIEQEGSPDDLYNRPATSFVAGFIGTPPMSLLHTERTDEGCSIVGESSIRVLDSAADSPVIGIRPEHISIGHDRDMDHDTDKGVRALLVSADYLGADTIVTARIGDQEVLVRQPGRFNVPEPVTARLRWDAACVHVFDRTTGHRNETARALST